METARFDLEPFEQETKPMTKIWFVKMEDDAHQRDELKIHKDVPAGEVITLGLSTSATEGPYDA